MSLSPQQLSTTLERLRRMRHARMLTAIRPKTEDDSLVPLLDASADCCALDNAIKALEGLLKAAAS